MRKYKVFVDEAGRIFVIWEDMVKDCLFAGFVGKMTEIDCGFFEDDKNQLKNLMMLQKKYNNEGRSRA